jgi:hypothetical protein
MKVEDVISELEKIEKAMKTPDFEANLNRRELNLSFAVLIIDALEAYLRGEVSDAVSAMTTVIDELGARRELERRGDA